MRLTNLDRRQLLQACAGWDAWCVQFARPALFQKAASRSLLLSCGMRHWSIAKCMQEAKIHTGHQSSLLISVTDGSL